MILLFVAEEGGKWKKAIITMILDLIVKT